MSRRGICRFYQRPGGCRRAQCEFLHEEPSNPSTTNNHSTHARRAPSGICDSYWSTGNCRFGFGCRFRHERESDASSTSSNQPWRVRAAAPQPLQYSTTMDNLTVSQVHNYMRRFLVDSFRFESSRDIYAFTALLGNATKENNWSVDDGQSLLTSIAKPGQNGLLRLADIIRHPIVSIDADISLSRISFQKAYIPLIMYFASDFVVKSTISHDVNSLYALIHNDFETFSKTIMECMEQVMVNGSFKNPNTSMVSSYLTGTRIFSAIATVIFEYVTRFRHATLTSPHVIPLIRKLDEWLAAWVVRINSQPPTFEDDGASQMSREARIFKIKYMQEQVGKLVTIAEREGASAVQSSKSNPAHFVERSDFAAVAYLGADFEGPGELRKDGPRHDNDFVDISQIRIAPTHQELIYPLPPYLPANVVDAPHHLPSNSMDRLLDVQFRLLREELIAPLRVALQCVLRDMQIPNANKTTLSTILAKGGGRYVGEINGNNRIMFNIYTKCTPAKLEFHPRKGITVDIGLDTPPGSARATQAASRKKFWEGRGGKRLMQGSLVALVWGSGDATKAYLGIVTSALTDMAASSRNSPDRIRIQINFFDSEIELRILRDLRAKNEDISPPFLIESPVIFETIRPFLQALCAEPTSLPFSKYLIPSKSLTDVSVDPPKYSTAPGFVYDLQCLFNEQPPQAISLRADDPDSIEISREALRSSSRLDPSQADALVDSLTREVSLIQGPPGTGKTFIGVELIRVLVKNKVGPILMIAFTNHALDHMLSAVIDSNITDRVVRLGSRSANERISEFNLETLEMVQGKTSLDNTLSSQYRELKQTQEELNKLLSQITQQQIDPERIKQHLHASYWDHFESLFSPPLWISFLQDEDKEWEIQGSRKRGNTFYDIWEEGRDLAFLSSRRDSNRRPSTQPSTHIVNGNRYEALQEEVEDTNTVDPDEEDMDNVSALLDQLNLGPAVSWLQSWELHDVASQQEDASSEEEPRVQQSTGQVEEEKNSIIDTFFGKGGLPEISQTNRPLQDLLAPKINVWELSKTERIKLSRHWKEELQFLLIEEESTEFTRLRQVYENQRRHYNEIKDQASPPQLVTMKLRLLKNKDIVGCTTTGAAKFTGLLKSFSPKVLLVEEAGQVLEAHVLSNLVPSVEHLVLIGDPLQLRPNLANYNLSIDSKRGAVLYRFDVSMMERLSTTGLSMSQLEIQRRMRPSIAQLIRNTLYPSLQDHPLTEAYPNVKGMSKNVFFMSHEHRETGGGEDSVSKHNAFEVEMTVALLLYLLRQGCYSEDGDIVVLCAYLGQLVRMRDALAGKVVTLIDDRDQELLAAHDDGEEREDSVGVERVALNKKVWLRTIDNFQGEEAKIIILSLVRNSGSDDDQDALLLGAVRSSIGFLKSRNRTNVALSRAQHGLYIMGNANDLAKKSLMWASIVDILDNEDCLGTSFPIACPKHPEQRHHISNPGMFAQVAPDGGCLQPCAEQLPCGHVCPYKCHSDDEKHISVSCRQKCLRQCSKGHPCDKLCSTPCEACMHPVINVSLPCGHTSPSVPCHLFDDLSKVSCQEMVEKSYSTCEHKRTMKCSEDIDSTKCNETCGVYLSCCGRNCQSSCSGCQGLNARTTDGRISRTSHHTHPCRRTLFCGHMCKEPCSESHECTKRCTERCQRRCNHAICTKPCYVVCAPCAEPCSWSCPHMDTCPLPCGSICSRLPCDERCTITLKCGHRCASLCGEPCAICTICAPDNRKADVVDLVMGITLGELEPGNTLDTLIFTLSCSHTFTVETLDGTCEIESIYKHRDGVWSGALDHSSTPGFKKAPMCPTCRSPITIPRYGRAFKRSALDTAELNIASDMSQSLAQIQQTLQRFRENSGNSPNVDDIKRRVKLFSLTEEDKTRILVAQRTELKNASRDKILVSARVFALVGKKSVHRIPAGIAEIWKSNMAPLIRIYRRAAETAMQRPAHIRAYQNALSTLYQLELETFAKLSTGGPRNPEENAMRIARLKVGRPPPRADKRFCVEAIWLSVKIRFKLADFGETMLKSIGEASSPSTIFVWGCFMRFIYLSCVQDVGLALEIAVESESHKQIVTSRLLDLQAKFEQFRFDVEMRKLQCLSKEDRLGLAEETRRLRDEALLSISSSRREFNAQGGNNQEWLQTNFLEPGSRIITHWEELETSLRGNTFYQPVSRDELSQIVRAFDDFTHTGHWYQCQNGHIYTIGECGGAMERAVCPECGASIGGTNHDLDQTNQHATELERIAREQGARESPWAWARQI
ncbi:hypothetical protein M422DRAFT_66154 [Sphaerobolus stellatus SS14]|nr:hypothetical protein M422DRAFT_66154 [Sphaerobolus stellatus SS14]